MKIVTRALLALIVFGMPAGMGFAASAHAQSGQPQPDFKMEDQDKGGNPSLENQVVEKVVSQVQDGYLPTSYQNLAKAYWAIGALDKADDETIDDFLQITECDLYLQFFNNDFEWAKIRDATRASINRDMKNFPTKFEAILPIKLGKYDMAKKEFEIPPEYQQSAVTRIAVVTNSAPMICGVRGPLSKFPANIVVLLNQPFSLLSLPVDPQIARMYIMDTRFAQDPTDKGTQRYQFNSYQRNAYIRLKLHLVQFKSVAYDARGNSLLQTYALLDGWDVYADADETKPLYSFVPRPSEKRRLLQPAAPQEQQQPVAAH